MYYSADNVVTVTIIRPTPIFIESADQYGRVVLSAPVVEDATCPATVTVIYAPGPIPPDTPIGHLLSLEGHQSVVIPFPEPWVLGRADRAEVIVAQVHNLDSGTYTVFAFGEIEDQNG